jgi:hypothetical protein
VRLSAHKHNFCTQVPLARVPPARVMINDVSNINDQEMPTNNINQLSPRPSLALLRVGKRFHSSALDGTCKQSTSIDTRASQLQPVTPDYNTSFTSPLGHPLNT